MDSKWSSPLFCTSVCGYWFKARGGTLKLFFDGVCSPRSETLPLSRIFLPQKMADLTTFLKLQLFLRVFFSPQKQLIFRIFHNFCKMGPFLKAFLAKMRPMSKDFLWKTNPFGRHIPIYHNLDLKHNLVKQKAEGQKKTKQNKKTTH